jgi:carboxylate-amine ligase
MRITDMCTMLDDTACIAAFYVCILRMLYRLRRKNQRWRRYSTMLVRENRWLAQRYGFEKGLVDFGSGKCVPYHELLTELQALIAEDAEFFGCVNEIGHAQTILARGTSAHRQVAAFDGALAEGASETEALHAVVDLLIEETRVGITAS